MFDDKRVPFAFDRELLGTSIDSHPLASRLPTASSSNKPQILGLGEDFVQLIWRPGDPKTLEDYIFSDRPMLGARIISFIDATLLTISWSHILIDGSELSLIFFPNPVSETSNRTKDFRHCTH